VAKSLYVGNLPFDVSEEELRQLFAAWGPVTAVRLIPDKGFGFVEVPDEKAAEAISGVNGKEFKGRNLKVDEARPRQERPRREGGGGYGRGPRGGGGGRGRGRRW